MKTEKFKTVNDMLVSFNKHEGIIGIIWKKEEHLKPENSFKTYFNFKVKKGFDLNLIPNEVEIGVDGASLIVPIKIEYEV